MPVDWRGDEIQKKILDQAKQAIDQTTAAAVRYAKSNHPWKNVTSTLEGSIMMKPSVYRGGLLIGEWGSFDVRYAIFLELGTSKMPAYPYLRPAADAEYPNLAKRLQELR